MPCVICTICDEKYNKTKHKKIECPHCHQSACLTCYEAYLTGTSSVTTFQCMFPDCDRREWTRRECHDMFSKKLMYTLYRQMRQEKLFQHEQSLLPQIQPLIERNNEAKRRCDEAIAATKQELKDRLKELSSEPNKCSKNMLHKQPGKAFCYSISSGRLDVENSYWWMGGWDDESTGIRIRFTKYRFVQPNHWYCCDKSKAIHRLILGVHELERRRSCLSSRYRRYVSDDEFRRLNFTDHTRPFDGNGIGTDDAQQPRRQHTPHFIRACPYGDCRGFLNSDWKCGLCDNRTCSKCHVVIGKEEKEHSATTTSRNTNINTHVCNPDDVKSAKLLDKDSKPCPKCASMIFKISGCDQMWCTACNTAFSWKTGEAIDPRIMHNPHFFEWLRRNPENNRPHQGHVPRNPNDIIQCGRELTYDMSTQIQRRLRANGNSEDEVEHAYHMFRTINHIRAHHIRAVPDANNETNRDLRWDYMTNKLTLQQFKDQVERNNTEDEKQREIRAILTTFVQVSTDIFYDFYDSLNVKKFDEWQEFIRYINDECLAELKSMYKMSVRYMIRPCSPTNPHGDMFISDKRVEREKEKGTPRRITQYV